MARREYYYLNCGITPDWFTNKVHSKEIECVYIGTGQNKIICECRFYDTSGREKTIYSGGMIAKDMIYPE